MALPSLHQVLDEFNSEISSSLKLLYKIENNPGVLHQPQVDLIFGLAFLKIFIAWEQFLEDTFARYMCGASSLSGNKPTRNETARYLDRALSIIYGGQPYAGWASVDIVVERANRFFDKGEPYTTPLQSAAAELNSMRKVRNHIVHHSKKSREDFNKLLVGVYGFRPQGMSAGRFLRQRVGINGEQRIQEYAKTLESLSNMIVS